MRKIIKNLVLLSFAIIFALGAAGLHCLFYKPSVNADVSASAITTATPLSLSLHKRNAATGQESEEKDHGQQGDKSYYVYSWQTTDSVDISFVYSSSLPLAKEGNYHYSYSVVYYQRYKDSISQFDGEIKNGLVSKTEATDPSKRPEITAVDDIESGDVEDLEDIPKMTYYFDRLASEKDKDDYRERDKHHGDDWGIYIFSLSIVDNDISVPMETYKSDYIIIEPNTLTVEDQTKLVVKSKVSDTSSISGLQDAFDFWIEVKEEYSAEAEKFQYLDKYCIKWYVEGDANGIPYKLEYRDLSQEEIAQGYEAIYENIPSSRIGLTFYLDLQGRSGEWNVRFGAYDPSSVDTSPRPEDPIQDKYAPGKLQFASDPITVKSGAVFSTSILIWILVILSIVILLMLLFIIINSIRKERVW